MPNVVNTAVHSPQVAAQIGLVYPSISVLLVKCADAARAERQKIEKRYPNAKIIRVTPWTLTMCETETESRHGGWNWNRSMADLMRFLRGCITDPKLARCDTLVVHGAYEIATTMKDWEAGKREVVGHWEIDVWKRPK